MSENPSGMKLEYHLDDDLERETRVTTRHVTSKEDKRRVAVSTTTATTASCCTPSEFSSTDQCYDVDRIGGWKRTTTGKSPRYQEHQDHTRSRDCSTTATSGRNSDIHRDPSAHYQERSTTTATTVSCRSLSGFSSIGQCYEVDRIGGWKRTTIGMSPRYQEHQDHTRSRDCSTTATSGRNSDILIDPLSNLHPFPEKQQANLEKGARKMAARTNNSATSRFASAKQDFQWGQSARIMEGSAKRGPDFKAQVNSRSIIDGNPNESIDLEAEAARTVVSSDTMAVVEAKIASVVPRFGDQVPRFKDQVRSVTSAENKAERYLQSGIRGEEPEVQRRDVPTQTASVWEPTTVPTVPAIRVDNSASRALLPESRVDSAIQLSYEGPTEEEINLLRLKVMNLQSRLRDQDDVIRQLRAPLDDSSSAAKGRKNEP